MILANTLYSFRPDTGLCGKIRPPFNRCLDFSQDLLCGAYLEAIGDNKEIFSCNIAELAVYRHEMLMGPFPVND
jgi:hypothetical protein